MKTLFNHGLVKHQKKVLIACSHDDCFHPATEMYVIGSHNLWFCDCHNPISPKECHTTTVAKENEKHPLYGACAFCSNTHSYNILHGIDGKISYVCDKCYLTPLHELRHYWK